MYVNNQVSHVPKPQKFAFQMDSLCSTWLLCWLHVKLMEHPLLLVLVYPIRYSACDADMQTSYNDYNGTLFRENLEHRPSATWKTEIVCHKRSDGITSFMYRKGKKRKEKTTQNHHSYERLSQRCHKYQRQQGFWGIIASSRAVYFWESGPLDQYFICIYCIVHCVQFQTVVLLRSPCIPLQMPQHKNITWN